MYSETLAKVEPTSHFFKSVSLAVQIACLSDHHELAGSLVTRCLPIYIGKSLHEIRSLIDSVDGIVPDFVHKLVRDFLANCSNSQLIICHRHWQSSVTYTMCPSFCGGTASAFLATFPATTRPSYRIGGTRLNKIRPRRIFSSSPPSTSWDW